MGISQERPFLTPHSSFLIYTWRAQATRPTSSNRARCVPQPRQARRLHIRFPGSPLQIETAVSIWFIILCGTSRTPSPTASSRARRQMRLPRRCAPRNDRRRFHSNGHSSFLIPHSSFVPGGAQIPAKRRCGAEGMKKRSRPVRDGSVIRMRASEAHFFGRTARIRSAM